MRPAVGVGVGRWGGGGSQIRSHDLLEEHLCETFSIVWDEDHSSIKKKIFLTKPPSSRLSSSKNFNHTKSS